MPNKAQFVELLAERLDGDKKKAQTALDAVIDTVYHAVSKGERVVLTGFGVFEKRDRAARIARNPATGASVKVKKTSVPAFRAGAEFKAIISGAKKLAKLPVKKASAAAKKTAAPAKTAAATKAPAAKKAPATKAAATKAAAKAPAAKAAAVKAPAVKAPAVKAAAVKAPAAKKAPAKKAVAKKAVAKKAG